MFKSPDQKCDGTLVFGPHKLAAAGWENWGAFKHMVAPGLWSATHTSDSGSNINGDAILQVLFDKWTATVQEELADNFGLEASPLPLFQTKYKKITALVKQHTGTLTRASDQYEWLWRRLTELRSTISQGRNPEEGLKALQKGVKGKNNLLPWLEIVVWLRSGSGQPTKARALQSMWAVWTNLWS